MSQPPDGDRLRALSLLRRHGASAVSFQLLEPGFRYFFDGDEGASDDAFVAYVDTGSAWVAGGAPVASATRLRAVGRAFEGEARRQDRRVCFFGVEPSDLEPLGGAALQLGEQPLWDPRTWDETLEKSSSLRYQLRRAQKKGVRIRRVSPAELVTEASAARRGIARVIARWQRSRPMAPMGFLVDLQPFGFASERFTFVAERGGRVVGFVAAVPMYARGGWLLEDLVRADDAPNGTAELLFDAALREAAARGATVATLGLAPLAGEIPRILAVARDLSTGLYDFRGLHAFKRKLAPQSWEPIYLCAPGQSWLALYDALVAFARGSMLRFGLRSLLRGPEIAVRVLTGALSVWILLVSLRSSHWLATSAAKWSWILAHLGALAGLGALIRKYRGWLTVLLATALGLDGLLTLGWLGRPGVAGLPLGDAFGALAAGAGPALTSAALWAMWRRRSAA